MRRQQAAESSWWSIAVPKQQEVDVPYELAMSAEELLQELVSQRLEQEFQLLEQPGGGAGAAALSLAERQTYFLGLAGQVQQITFMQELSSAALPARKPAPMSALARTARAAPPAAPSEKEFSKIKVTRHFIKPSVRSAVRGFVYDYMVSGPQSTGFQRFFTKLSPASPLDHPWNRVDQNICGWESTPELPMRLRCKRKKVDKNK